MALKQVLFLGKQENAIKKTLLFIKKQENAIKKHFCFLQNGKRSLKLLLYLEKQKIRH